MIPQPNPQPWPGPCDEMFAVPGLNTISLTASRTATGTYSYLGSEDPVQETTINYADSITASAYYSAGSCSVYQTHGGGVLQNEFVWCQTSCCNSTQAFSTGGNDALGTGTLEYSCSGYCGSGWPNTHPMTMTVSGSVAFRNDPDTGAPEVNITISTGVSPGAYGYDYTFPDDPMSMPYDASASTGWIAQSDLIGTHTLTVNSSNSFGSGTEWEEQKIGSFSVSFTLTAIFS